MQNNVAFISTIVSHAGIAGAIVGLFWSLALSEDIWSGIIWGAGISALAWTLYGLLVTAGRQVNQTEAVFAIGSMLVVVNGLASVVALIVWIVRGYL